MDQDTKRRAFDEALEQIEKGFGKGTVMKLDDPSSAMNVETTLTGSLSLDLTLGLSDISKGRIIEVYGLESSSKTTVALHMVTEMQKRGGIADFIDAKYTLDPIYAKGTGVNTNNPYISQPNTGEQALGITETTTRSGAVDIIIVDLVVALASKAEIEGDMDDLHVGLQARLMSQALRKLTSIVSNTNSTVVFVNQLREKIGVMLDSPETTTGDRALELYSSVRLDVRKIDVLKQGGEVVDTRVRMKAVKDKIAPPFKEIEFDIILDKGISKGGDILDLTVKENIVEKSDAWFSYEGNKIGRGRENTKSFPHEHPALVAKIGDRVREAHGLVPVKTEALPEGAELTLPLTKERDAE